MPEWVKNIVDQWIQAANITFGQVVSSGAQNGEGLGREADRKGGLALWFGSMPRRLGSTS
jgi:hypothetical protein